MEPTQADELFGAQQFMLDIEHRKALRVATSYNYQITMNQTREEIIKTLRAIKLIYNEDNYYHAAFYAHDITGADCDIIIKIIKEKFTINDQFTLGGLYVTMNWNETPGKKLDIYNLNASERNINSLSFTKRVYLYTNYIPDSYRDPLHELFKNNGYIVSLRDTETWNTMQNNRRADYFLCHDSRDKPIARELFNALKKEGLKIFFDEYNIDFGDSIYQKIEEGIRDSRFGLILVTNNFIKNQAWAKKLEFESFVVKYLGTGQNIIIPVWSAVTVEEVRNASPMLAGLKAINTDIGYEAIAKELRRFADKHE
jgi:hypothetical protein